MLIIGDHPIGVMAGRPGPADLVVDKQGTVVAPYGQLGDGRLAAGRLKGQVLRVHSSEEYV